MKLNRLAPASLFLAAATLGACGSTETAAAPEAMAMPSPEEQQAMMMAMMTAAAPGPNHERLMSLAGDWTVQARYRMDPTGPWTEAAATAKLQKALGGRMLVQKFNGKLSMGPGMDMQLDGLELTGFNNLTQKYESYWFDNMSTWCTFTQGVEENGVLDLKGMMSDAITPAGRPVRFTRRIVDADHFVTEAFDTIPPLGEVKVMELSYARAQP